MLLDFTPENVFIKKGRLRYVDPWMQQTYRGSLIPSIGIFSNLLINIYKLPSAQKEVRNFNVLAQEIGKLLNLDKTQIYKQLMLGKMLQYTVSSYVRRNTERETSVNYAISSLEILSNIL